ncbi:MAG: c-type cytochrome [Cytophagales bacterium]|jgi:cytochrome c peroxidase|nr:c-type cytochrome [Cytophagales bacterium]
MNTVRNRWLLFWSLAAVWLLYAGGCRPSDPEPATPPAPGYELTVPRNFPAPKFTFGENPITKDGVELGRFLFFDPRLSSSGTIACGTCHRQLFAFADHGHDKSHGVNDRRGERNTPALQNLAFMPDFMWDGGVTHIDFSPLNAIQNPAEMDETVASILDKLKNTPAYKPKFRAAFGNDSITSQRMLRALSQFMGLMVSSNSKYDNYVRGENGIALNGSETAGLRLFQQKCASCHATDLFTDHSFRNNGLDATPADLGRERITNNPADRGKFRVPSLRNVERTSPYMHDGRFVTLNDVLNHYASEVKDSPTLDPLLKQNGRLGIPLTAQEKQDIIAFLKTLTDPSFLVDKRFADPIGTANQR